MFGIAIAMFFVLVGALAGLLVLNSTVPNAHSVAWRPLHLKKRCAARLLSTKINGNKSNTPKDFCSGIFKKFGSAGSFGPTVFYDEFNHQFLLLQLSIGDNACDLYRIDSDNCTVTKINNSSKIHPQQLNATCVKNIEPSHHKIKANCSQPKS